MQTTAEWTAQQLREPFPSISSRDIFFGTATASWAVSSAETGKPWGSRRSFRLPASPWERALVERVIGTIRRECLDPVIVFHQAPLHRHVKSFLAYYHESRTHRSLAKDSPEPRPVHSAECGAVVAIPQVGGLHHRYERRAA